MSEQEIKVVHTIKLDRSIVRVLWVFAIALMLNAIPSKYLITDVMAEQLYGTMTINHRMSGSVSL
jgi:hypothetical protein